MMISAQLNLLAKSAATTQHTVMMNDGGWLDGGSQTKTCIMA